MTINQGSQCTLIRSQKSTQFVSYNIQVCGEQVKEERTWKKCWIEHAALFIPSLLSPCLKHSLCYSHSLLKSIIINKEEENNWRVFEERVASNVILVSKEGHDGVDVQDICWRHKLRKEKRTKVRVSSDWQMQSTCSILCMQYIVQLFFWERVTH